MHKIIDNLLVLLEAARNAGPRIEATLKARLVADLGKLHDKITVAEQAGKLSIQKEEARLQAEANALAAKTEAAFDKLYALADKHGVEV